MLRLGGRRLKSSSIYGKTKVPTQPSVSTQGLPLLLAQGSDVSFFASLALVPNLAGTRQSSDQPDHELDQPDGPKPSQKPMPGIPAEPTAAAGSTTQGADFSPPSEGRSGKGGGHAAPAGATKTIQSYFYKPSNSTAVQNLAASYGTLEPAGQARAASGLPNEVDLSGADEDSHRGEPSLAPPLAKVGRSGSTGAVGGGGAGDGRSLQQRFSHAVSSAGDQSAGQAQHGHRHVVQGRAQMAELADGGVGSADGEQAGSDREAVEKLHESLREAKALETQLRKELARANLERGSMETMVGPAPPCPTGNARVVV